jgi:hypothetical protein
MISMDVHIAFSKAPYKAQFSHYVGVGDFFVNNEESLFKCI